MTWKISAFLPEGEKMLSMTLFRDQLFVATDVRVYRLAGPEGAERLVPVEIEAFWPDENVVKARA